MNYEVKKHEPIVLKSGTKLPLIDLKGKPYLQIAHRLVWFREDHPTWGIETEQVMSAPGAAVFKATIKDETGRIIANAHKMETKEGFPDYIEKAETGSIGRALAACGYGTQFEPALDEGERLADAPVERPVVTDTATEKQIALIASLRNKLGEEPLTLDNSLTKQEASKEIERMKSILESEEIGSDIQF